MTTKQAKRQDMNRNPTGKGGFAEHPEFRNNGGRPRNPLKEYQREKFSKMTEEEKEEFLKQVGAFDRWKMAEGNPESPIDVKGEITSKQTLTDDQLKAINDIAFGD